MAEPILEVRGLVVHYGHIQALRGIDLSVPAGAITALVGANGAGKTTTLLTLSGLVRPKAGSIRFLGEDIARLRPDQIVKRGLAHVPEGRSILTRLTIAENLDLGAYTRRDKARVAADLEWVYSLFPRLKEREKGLAGNLSGGEQQMLAIGRALMSRPRLLLLDEPSMGLAPIIVQDIFRLIGDINARGISVLLVEQNVRQALKLAGEGYVLETGSVALHDQARTLLDDPRVIEAYLGG